MHLYSNRPEGFGPNSALHPSLPTTCFIDTIVVPLASWIYLLLAAFVLLPVIFLSRGRDPSSHSKDIPSTSKRTKLRKTALIIYAFLLLALLAMLSLEIARLVNAELGVGLLPFLYPAVILAAGLRACIENQWMRASKKFGLMCKASNVFFWVLLVVVMSIKVAAYCLEGLESRDRMRPQEKYRVVDQVTDLGVMVGLVVFSAGLEAVL